MTVVFLARKALLQNSRIFKQAEALAAEGWDVELVGLRTPGTSAEETRDGYRIVRVPLDPLHARLLRRLLRRPDPLAGAAPGEAAVPVETGGRLRHLLRAAAGPLLPVLRSRDWNRRAWEHVTRTHDSVDVVHANDLDTLGVGLRLARRCGCPLVYDAQELYTEIHTLPALYRRGLGARERLLLRHVSALIAVNPLIAAELERRYGRRVDAVVLNAAPQEEAREGSVSLHAAAALDAGRRLVVFSGGLMPFRGIEQTVRALPLLPDDVALVLLGGGPLRPELEALAEAEGVRDRLAFVDYVPHRDVPALLRDADVGVVPYRNIGLNHFLSSPSKLFHFIAAGLPVAASELPFLVQVVRDEGLGEVFDPERPESIAAAIGRILADPEPYRARVAAARTKYSWETERERFLEIYRSLPPREGATPAGAAEPQPRPES
jgi:glycosyltransferase involved in cell wall biosynthesis